METDILNQSFSDMEAMANMQAQGRYAGDKNLIVQFHSVPVMNEEKSREEGRPIYDDKEHVRILIPGSKESVVDKIVTDIERARFADLYKKWKANEQLAESGTPLEACTWIARSLVEEMKFFNIRTVQQLATLSDTHAQKFPGITRLRDLAKAYLAEAEKGKAAAEVAKMIEDQKKENADLREMIKGLQDTINKMQQGFQEAPAPRRRKVAAPG